MLRSVRAYVAPLYLGACLALGGASAGGPLANGLLQIVAVILIAALLWSKRISVPPEARLLALTFGFFVIVVLISLIPLPPGPWQQLPLRQEISQGLALLGITDVWMPLSLAPADTVASLLWLLPPAAMFLLAVRLPSDQRSRLQATVLIVAVFSIVLGAFQIFGGSGSSLRFYEISSPVSALGFFANVNHQATLLLSALPLAGVIAARFIAKRSARSKRSGGMIISISAAIFLTIGVVLTGSMAGYGLFLFAAAAALLIYRRAVVGRVTGKWMAALAASFVLFLVGSLAGPLSQQSLAGEFSEHPTSRKVIAATSMQPIKETFPVGSGLGTFADVYRRYENPQLARTTYVNHAHNDYLEFVLELGLPGILIIIGFLIWWVRRSIYAWSNNFSGAALARAGSVIVGLVLVHSFVDYPVRTSAIASIFAMACAFLVPFTSRSEALDQKAGDENSLRHLSAD